MTSWMSVSRWWRGWTGWTWRFLSGCESDDDVETVGRAAGARDRSSRGGWRGDDARRQRHAGLRPHRLLLPTARLIGHSAGLPLHEIDIEPLNPHALIGEAIAQGGKVVEDGRAGGVGLG